MKKLAFVIPLVMLVASGCNSSQKPVFNQTPAEQRENHGSPASNEVKPEDKPGQAPVEEQVPKGNAEIKTDSEGKGSYAYNGALLTMSNVYDGKVNIFLTQNGVKKQIVTGVGYSIAGGSYPEFQKTENPDIALLRGGDGDAGYYRIEYYLILISKKQVFSVVDTNGPLIIVKGLDGKTSNITLSVSKPCTGTPNASGNATLNGLSVNGKLSYKLKSPLVMKCLPNEGFGYSSDPYADFHFGGFSKDLTKVYLKFNEYADVNNPSGTKVLMDETFSYDLKNGTITFVDDPKDFLYEVAGTF